MKFINEFQQTSTQGSGLCISHNSGIFFYEVKIFPLLEDLHQNFIPYFIIE